METLLDLGYPSLCGRQASGAKLCAVLWVLAKGLQQDILEQSGGRFFAMNTKSDTDSADVLDEEVNISPDID